MLFSEFLSKIESEAGNRWTFVAAGKAATGPDSVEVARARPLTVDSASPRETAGTHLDSLKVALRVSAYEICVESP